MVVTTFTAARGMSSSPSAICRPKSGLTSVHLVKQEIAKEGVLPYSLFLSKNVNVGAIITKRFSRTSENLEDATDNLPEPIPLPALCLHGVFTTFLILGTFKISQSQDIYPFVVGKFLLLILLSHQAVYEWIAKKNLRSLQLYHRCDGRSLAQWRPDVHAAIRTFEVEPNLPHQPMAQSQHSYHRLCRKPIPHIRVSSPTVEAPVSQQHSVVHGPGCGMGIRR